MCQCGIFLHIADKNITHDSGITPGFLAWILHSEKKKTGL